MFPELAYLKIRAYTHLTRNNKHVILCKMFSAQLFTPFNPNITPHRSVNFAMPFMETYSTWSSQGIFYTDSWNDDTITFLPDGQEVRELPPKPITLLLHGLGSLSSFYHTITPAISPSICCIALDYPGSGFPPPYAIILSP